MKRNRTIPQIPKPAPSAVPPGVETKPCSDLTKSAIQLLQQKFSMEAEGIAAQAAKLEGVNPEEGWKLDLAGVWFRPKPENGPPKT